MISLRSRWKIVSNNGMTVRVLGGRIASATRPRVPNSPTSRSEGEKRFCTMMVPPLVMSQLMTTHEPISPTMATTAAVTVAPATLSQAMHPTIPTSRPASASRYGSISSRSSRPSPPRIFRITSRMCPRAIQTHQHSRPM